MLIFHNTSYLKEKNTISIKIGVVATSDETVELSYGETAKSVILFYDRDLFYHLYAELEVVYSKIDRLGENELDLGGIHYNFGIFYMF